MEDLISGQIYPRHIQVSEGLKEEQYYFNKQETDNPYLFIISPTEIENVSDSFIICSSQQFKSEQFEQVEYLGRLVLLVADLEKMRSSIREFAEQLKSGECSSINNPEFFNAFNRTVSFRSEMANLGITVNRSNAIVLKKIRKPKPKEKVCDNLPLVCSQFKWGLHYYCENVLGFNLHVSVGKTTIYKVITAFKTMLPNVSFQDLNNATHDSFGHECEQFWNNPELLLPKTKKGKK